MRRTPWLAALAAASLGVAACGGGDDNSDLSYSAFGRAANEICSDLNDELEPLRARLNGQARNDAPIIDQVVDARGPALEDFRELNAPDELQTDFEAFIDVSEQQLEQIRLAAATAKSGNTAEYRAMLQGLGSLDQEGDSLASKLGADECISN